MVKVLCLHIDCPNMVKMFEVISFVVILIFIYFGFYITFHTVQVISQWVVLWAEETRAHLNVKYMGFCLIFKGLWIWKHEYPWILIPFTGSSMAARDVFQEFKSLYWFSVLTNYFPNRFQNQTDRTDPIGKWWKSWQTTSFDQSKKISTWLKKIYLTN